MLPAFNKAGRFFLPLGKEADSSFFYVLFLALLVYITENEYICNTITRAVIILITNHRRPTG